MNINEIISAADKVLERLANMSDAELLIALDAATGGAVAYAFDNNARTNTFFHSTSFSNTYSFNLSFTQNSLMFETRNSLKPMPFQAMNNDCYALAA